MPMKIVLASTNQAKIAATKRVFEELFDEIEIVPIEVESKVSKTPDTDNEGIQGSLLRIESARKLNPNADAYVGLEGIITKNSYGVFLCGWAAVEIEGKRGLGCSAKIELPKTITAHAHTFAELNQVVKEHYPSELISEMPEIGTNGVITRKLYTRVDEFEDAIKCALGYALNN